LIALAMRHLSSNGTQPANAEHAARNACGAECSLSARFNSALRVGRVKALPAALRAACHACSAVGNTPDVAAAASRFALAVAFAQGITTRSDFLAIPQGQPLG
jgi:hypothetical protein